MYEALGNTHPSCLTKLQRNCVTHTHIVGEHKMTPFGKTFVCSQNQIKQQITQTNKNTIYTLLGIFPRDMKAHFHAGTCIQMFIAILFVRAGNWKPAKYPVMAEWVNELGSIHPYNDAVARI